jgi:hypothetical protein
MAVRRRDPEVVEQVVELEGLPWLLRILEPVRQLRDQARMLSVQLHQRRGELSDVLGRLSLATEEAARERQAREERERQDADNKRTLERVRAALRCPNCNESEFFTVPTRPPDGQPIAVYRFVPDDRATVAAAFPSGTLVCCIRCEQHCYALNGQMVPMPKRELGKDDRVSLSRKVDDMIERQRGRRPSRPGPGSDDDIALPGREP